MDILIEKNTEKLKVKSLVLKAPRSSDPGLRWGELDLTWKSPPCVFIVPEGALQYKLPRRKETSSPASCSPENHNSDQRDKMSLKV